MGLIKSTTYKGCNANYWRIEDSGFIKRGVLRIIYSLYKDRDSASDYGNALMTNIKEFEGVTLDELNPEGVNPTSLGYEKWKLDPEMESCEDVFEEEE